MNLKKLEKAFVGKKIALDFFDESCIDAEIMRIIPFSDLNAIPDESSIYNEWYDLSKLKSYHDLQDDDPIAIVEIAYNTDNYYQAAYPLETVRYSIL